MTSKSFESNAPKDWYTPSELSEIWARVWEQLAHDGLIHVLKVQQASDNYVLRQILYYAEEVMSERSK